MRRIAAGRWPAGAADGRRFGRAASHAPGTRGAWQYARDVSDLQRFIDAQDRGGTYEQALAELRAGRKQTHWVWFIFPQLAGLGQSETARRYAITSLGEARKYLTDPVLGARLHACLLALLEHDRPAKEILGEIDAVKLRSSMTLFLRAEPREQLFRQVLDRFFEGTPDAHTDELLARNQGTAS